MKEALRRSNLVNLRGAVVLIPLAVLLGSCDTTLGLEPFGMMCEPRTTRSCECGVNTDGYQECAEDGESWTQCRCICSTGYTGEDCQECAPGWHEDHSGSCILDDTCLPTSCGGFGSCDDSSGHVECSCNIGYEGAHCQRCFAGYVKTSQGACWKNVLVDWDMEHEDASAYMVHSDATLTKEAGRRTGGDGFLVLRVTAGEGPLEAAKQVVLVPGNVYRIEGWARGDGKTGKPTFLLHDTDAKYNWLGTNSTMWQRFELTAEVFYSAPYFRTLGEPGSYTEWDDVIIELVQDNSGE